MRNELAAAIKQNLPTFDLQIDDSAVERLADYYEIVLEHNPLLHLVGPCSPSEFATRHILESLTLLEHLPANTQIVDVGSGGGLPAIPCLLVREDLKATLIESKTKKAEFLSFAIEELGIGERATTVNKQFAETDTGEAQIVTCRAIERFAEIIPRLVKWSGRRTLLLFGGPNLAAALQAANVSFVQQLMPLSEQRYLLVCKR